MEFQWSTAKVRVFFQPAKPFLCSAIKLGLDRVHQALFGSTQSHTSRTASHPAGRTPLTRAAHLIYDPGQKTTDTRSRYI